MQTPFIEIRGRIDQLRSNLEEMSDEFTRISHPDFNPMDMPEVSGFSRFNGTPEQIFRTLEMDAVDAEIGYQLTSVAFCLRLMEITNTLIELQNQHKKSVPHAEWDEINDTIGKDGDKFIQLIDNAGALRLAREEIAAPPLLDEDSYRLQFHRLVDDFEQAQGGHIRWMFQYASKPAEILDHIFDARIAALETSIASVETVDERIQGHMADYAMIRIARDENIVKDSPLLLQTQQEKENFCRYKLPRALAMVNMLDKFTEDLQGMGTDYLSLDKFTVESYKPVSIGILPQITP